MTKIRRDRDTWGIERRYTAEKGGKPLKGFALDVTMRFSAGAFLTDHNDNGAGTMHFDTVEELCEFLTEQITLNYTKHFRSA
jgi:hypothetical protein